MVGALSMLDLLNLLDVLDLFLFLNFFITKYQTAYVLTLFMNQVPDLSFSSLAFNQRFRLRKPKYFH